MTNELCSRLLQHYENRGCKNTFTGRYHVYFLVFFETYKYVNDSIAREKDLKKWNRKKKMQLINTVNPSLKFLNSEVCSQWPLNLSDSVADPYKL
jgi:putative endonuclease